MPERFVLLRYFYIYDYKSICMVFDVNQYPTDIQIVEKKIELRKTLIYLVIPLGDCDIISNFYDKNMSKRDRCLHSIYGLCCRPYCLDLKVTAFK